MITARQGNEITTSLLNQIEASPISIYISGKYRARLNSSAANFYAKLTQPTPYFIFNGQTLAKLAIRCIHQNVKLVL